METACVRSCAERPAWSDSANSAAMPSIPIESTSSAISSSTRVKPRGRIIAQPASAACLGAAEGRTGRILTGNAGPTGLADDHCPRGRIAAAIAEDKGGRRPRLPERSEGQGRAIGQHAAGGPRRVGAQQVLVLIAHRGLIVIAVDEHDPARVPGCPGGGAELAVPAGAQADHAIAFYGLAARKVNRMDEEVDFARARRVEPEITEGRDPVAERRSHDRNDKNHFGQGVPAAPVHGRAPYDPWILILAAPAALRSAIFCRS